MPPKGSSRTNERDGAISPFPEYGELVSFFDGAPVHEYSDLPANVGTRTYTTELPGSERLECAIDPASDEVSIKLYRGGALALDLDLHWVTEFLIDSRKGQDFLVLRFKDENLEELRLRIRPTVSLSWGIKAYP